MQILARHVRVPADWQGDLAEHVHNVAVTFNVAVAFDDAFESVIKTPFQLWRSTASMLRFSFRRAVLDSGHHGVWKLT